MNVNISHLAGSEPSVNIFYYDFSVDAMFLKDFCTKQLYFMKQ